MIDRLRAWIALTLVGLAYRIAPVDVRPSLATATDAAPDAPRPGAFKIERRLAGNRWTLYEGSDAGLARRTFEGVRDRKELGRMTLKHNGQVRGTYEGPRS